MLIHQPSRRAVLVTAGFEADEVFMGQLNSRSFLVIGKDSTLSFDGVDNS
jgi:hypothetical protein